MLTLPIGDFDTGRYAYAHTVSDVMRELYVTRPVIAAGATGSITVYIDRRYANKYHAEFSRHLVTLNERRFRTQAQLRAWLKKHWHAMHDGSAVSP